LVFLGIHEIGQYLTIWSLIEHTTLSMEADRLVWKWSVNGEYTAMSDYLASFHGSANCRPNLEKLDTAGCQILLLARQFGSMLDGR
jgi:hypothetical protein